MTVAGSVEQEVRRSPPELGAGPVTRVPGPGVVGCAVAYAGLSGRPAPPSFHEEVDVGCAHGAAIPCVFDRVPLDDPFDPNACARTPDETGARGGLSVVAARYPLP